MPENKLTNQKPIMMNKNYQMKRLKLNFYIFRYFKNIGSFYLQVTSYIFMITIVEGTILPKVRG